MMRPAILQVTKRKRGNPNWGKPPLPSLALVTEFEAQVRRLALLEAEYVSSRELRLWCDRNRNRVYVPEWLLREWGMHVEAIFSGVA